MSAMARTKSVKWFGCCRIDKVVECMTDHVIALSFCLFFVCGCNDQKNTEVDALRTSVSALENRIAALEQDQQKRAMLRSTPQPAAPSPVSPATLAEDESLKDDPFLGAIEAPVVMVMFSDYQCLPCRGFFSQTLTQLKSEFISSGNMRLIFRDFPLASNPHAVLAANAAQCAGEQGAYWQFHDLLFENAEHLDKGDIDAIVNMTTGLDKKRLRSCIGASRYNREIEADISAGKGLGMKGAPGFFLGRRTAPGRFDGVFIRGAQPYEFIAEVLRSLLTVSPDSVTNVS